MTDRQTVLVIDDDPNLRKTLSDILRVKGYEALAAGDGSEGLALLRQRPVNVALIDLVLPDISGLEVLKKVKTQSALTEAIILTGNATLDSAIEATNQGAFSYLQKPYDVDQLLLHVRRAIEKQEAEETIARLASFPTLSPNPIIEADSGGRVTYRNPAAGTLFPELGTPGLPHPMTEGLKDVFTLLQAGTKKQLMSEVRVGDAIYERLMSLVPQSGLLRIYAVDVTLCKRMTAALRESEARYRTLFDISPDDIALVDLTGKILVCNRQVAVTHGYEGGEELAGRDIFELVVPEDRLRVREEVGKAVGGGRIRNIELNMLRKDGSRFPAEISCSVVDDAGGRPRALMAVARDITEMKRTRDEIEMHRGHLEELVSKRTRELEIARLHAEAADRAKSDFLSNMSHELKTPLNSIIGFSEIMADGLAGPVTAKQAEFLNDINESGRHLLALINDILDLTRIESGECELRPEEFSLRHLVEACLSLSREKALRHSIRLSCSIPEDLEPIFADERKLKQVLFNLVGNALKFTPDGGEVAVRARKVQKSGSAHDFIEISVEDTGVGISEEDRMRLFQPFQQLEASLTKRTAGTGFGLYFSKRLVELQQGSISVESKPGKGSRFIVTVPRRMDETLGQTDGAILQAGSAGTSEEGSQER